VVFVTASPNLTMTVEDVVEEGEVAVTRWTLRGTQRGGTEELGPPTGNKVEFEGPRRPGPYDVARLSYRRHHRAPGRDPKSGSPSKA
jgi:hypothetical protein